jgi:hypothetical protein
VPYAKRRTLSGEKWREEIAAAAPLQTWRNGLVFATRASAASDPVVLVLSRASAVDMGGKIVGNRRERKPQTRESKYR